MKNEESFEFIYETNTILKLYKIRYSIYKSKTYTFSKILIHILFYEYKIKAHQFFTNNKLQ